MTKFVFNGAGPVLQELDPRNPDSRIQRAKTSEGSVRAPKNVVPSPDPEALGLTCGAFSFIERKDDEEARK